MSNVVPIHAKPRPRATPHVVLIDRGRRASPRYWVRRTWPRGGAPSRPDEPLGDDHMFARIAAETVAEIHDTTLFRMVSGGRADD